MTKESSRQQIDTFSYQLGMINCFVEMVACGVKKLAISPPLTPTEYTSVAPASEKIVHEYGVSSYVEKSLLITDLQSEAFTRGKWSILYYRDENTLDAYRVLKARRLELEEADLYDESARKELSRDFMRLLSYPDDVIEAKLSQTEPTDPFILEDTQEES